MEMIRNVVMSLPMAMKDELVTADEVLRLLENMVALRRTAADLYKQTLVCN